MLSRSKQISYILHEIAAEKLPLADLQQNENYRQLAYFELPWRFINFEIENISDAKSRQYLRSIRDLYTFDFLLANFKPLNLRQTKNISVFEKTVFLTGLLYNPSYEYHVFNTQLTKMQYRLKEIFKEEGLPMRSQSKLSDPDFALSSIYCLNKLLFTEHGFKGRDDNIHSEECHMVQYLLEGGKMGIPLSLSALYLILAARLKLPVYGVNMPGRFLVKWDAQDLEIFIDPFNNGRLMEREKISRLLFKQNIQIQNKFFEKTTFDIIARRAFANLSALYRKENLSQKVIFIDYLTRYVTS